MYSLVYKIEKKALKLHWWLYQPLASCFSKKNQFKQWKKELKWCCRLLPTTRQNRFKYKWLPKQKTIQSFNIDALVFRKTRNENPCMQEIGVTSWPMPANLPTKGRSASTGQLVSPIFCVGGFSFLVFLKPWASILKVWMVFCLKSNFTFKYILTGFNKV